MPNYNRVIKNRIQKEDLDNDAGCLFLKKKKLALLSNDVF